ncbi:MAG TPA: hypothetical protein ENJ84_11920 [Gammaproteobacteria bacterium]|nr:hypothetical protein [Gammaproteobacteria bacterium]
MLVESLVKESTVELQRFRVVTVQKTGHGQEAELIPHQRYASYARIWCMERLKKAAYPAEIGFVELINSRGDTIP